MIFKTLDGLMKQVPILYEALDAIEDQTMDSEIRATANSF